MNENDEFLALSLAPKRLPKGHTITALTQATRRWLKKVSGGVCGLDAVEPEGLEVIPHSFLMHDRARWRGQACEAAIIRTRLALLGELSRANVKVVDRLDRSRMMVCEQMDVHTGFVLLVDSGGAYQLGVSKPWYKHGDFIDNNELFEQLDGERQELIEHGFVQIDKNVYLERVRQPILRTLLLDAECLQDVAAIVALYTASSSQRKNMAACTERTRKVLAVAIMRELEHRGATLPMKPLYSLPREMRNMQSLFVTMREDSELTVDSDNGIVHSAQMASAKARVIEESGRQQVLFFDTNLVKKSSGKPDALLAVRLDEDQTSTLDALVKAIELLDVDPAVLEHLPRVCAGIFSAAQRDKSLKFNHPGTFWDTESGWRLCKIVGFNPQNARHRKRIQDVRKVLERITLHREIVERDKSGARRVGTWRGPLLAAGADEIELTTFEREGLSHQHTLSSWSIAKSLWDMVLFEDEGGTPAFMSLDFRVFELDERSSIPFNLYWTLINRAYMSHYARHPEDTLDDAGRFSLKLQTLYHWGGLEGRFDRLNRFEKKLRESLGRMVECGLLLDWTLPDDVTTFETYLQQRLHVTFAQEQLRSLQRFVPSSPAPAGALS